MDPNPKRTKLLLQHQQTLTLDDHIDRISDLPDEILCHILSFLPTKYAAGTSTLSTRWKHLFPFIPKLSLDFDDSLLLHPNKDKDNNLISLATFAIFIYSVMKVVHINDLRVYNFSLKCQRNYDFMNIEVDYSGSQVASWVDLALCREVRVLTVQVDYKDEDDKGFMLFTNQFFYCSTVMWVTIAGRFFLDVPTVFFMPNLISLFLDGVKFRNGEAVQWLIRGCLFLEEFCLKYCEFEELDVLEITSTKLIRLVIMSCEWDEDYEVVLDVPNLEVLRYEADNIAYDYPVKNLSCVREAYIDIGISWGQELAYEPHYYEDIASGFVAACSNTETLYLSEDSLHAIHWSWESVKPTFCNLTTLKLGNVVYSRWLVLASLLESSPNLEVLEFTWGLTACEAFPDFVSRLTKREPQCLSSHLQKVKIEGFTWDGDELNVVEFFLKSAKVLREVEIVSDLSSEEQLNMNKKLSLVPKCSVNCEIVFASTEDGKFDL
ncbi:hypothetical protein LguiA_029270 [Lonicera macranthoides]